MLESRLSSLRFYADALCKETPLLEKTRKEGSKAFSIPGQEISPYVGKLLSLLVQIHKPKKILEIGTLCGYSALWLAKELDLEGHILSLEREPLFVEKAQKNIQEAQLQERITIQQGEAKDSLSSLVQNKEGPFDLIWIDADKKNYPLYLEYALLLGRKGTLLILDNLIPREEEIGNSHPLHTFTAQLAKHPQLDFLLLPTLAGEKIRLDALGIALLR